MRYFVKTPAILNRLFPGITWTGNKGGKELYLTFDDGPHDGETEALLMLLDELNIQATFFFTGKNAADNNTLMNKVRKSGHRIGNHSFSHTSAWKTSHAEFMKDVEKADRILKTNLFRPPYGHLKWRDYTALKRKYKVVLWSVMPGDWDDNVSAGVLLERMKKYISPGTIYVLHENNMAVKKIKEVFPDFVSFARREGYVFKTL